ncbi:unnamed protein product [Dicrocoelium dendriticum]|nr:unnamed protein product [Dicrocoelium dendriticum]
MHNAEVLRQVEAGYRMSRPADCPPELYDLMLECWAADENKRPHFVDIQRRLDEFCEHDRSSYRSMADSEQFATSRTTVIRPTGPASNGRPTSPKAFPGSIQIPVSP